MKSVGTGTGYPYKKRGGASGTSSVVLPPSNQVPTNALRFGTTPLTLGDSVYLTLGAPTF